MNTGVLCRLATYGTLSPGEINHHEVSMIPGRWCQGVVRGRRYDSGWGAASGYPGFVPDAEGGNVCVWLLESDDLPKYWSALDEFEGEGYERRTIEVGTEDGVVWAQIYCMVERQSSGGK